ncbi:MAG: DUF6371 domain-containing protein [Bacteroidales bacterium]|nr:DUF6371 domain-containing protein [Bacteroidales bacterium]
MQQHRFILEPYKGLRTRHICPACERKGEFVSYIDTENNYSLPDHVGRCNRESSCGYHYTPKQFFEDCPNEKQYIADKKQIESYAQAVEKHRVCVPKAKKTDYFEYRVMISSMARYETNSFTNALQTIFDEIQIKNIIHRYFLGTTKDEGVIFWQVDVSGNVRYGKRMHYTFDLHRDKTKHPVGVHSLMRLYHFNHKQCFFGEHLLSIPENKDKAVAIVESEKTACICSELLPDYIWLATGGKNGCRWADKEVCKVLSNRKVILLPDVDAHQSWVEKSNILVSYGIQVFVFDSLVQLSPETQYDVADCLIWDIQNRKQQVSIESVVQTDTTIFERMKVKNPSFEKLVKVFDCKITDEYQYEPLPKEQLAMLGEKLPDFNSFTKKEIAEILKIEIFRVEELIQSNSVYFIHQTAKYCKAYGVPF